MKKTQELYKAFKESQGVSIDTRTLREGQMFFAINGPNFNGHNFVEKAFELGVKYAVISDAKYCGPNRILVEDSTVALQELAKYHRQALGLKAVIGITGTNGKTTTKELLYAVLSKKYKLIATKGNLNNHLGVPLTLLRLNTSHEMAIVEMGASKQGDIEELCNIALPTHGIVTNIGRAHLLDFHNLETIASTKKEMYDAVIKNDGYLFIDENEESLKGIIPDYDKTESTVSGLSITDEAPFLSFRLEENDSITYRTQLFGDYNLKNIAYALTLGDYFGVARMDSLVAIIDYQPSNQRSEIRTIGKSLVIVDAYNANPESLSNALSGLAQQDGIKRIAFIGDMLELGKNSIQLHQEIVDKITHLNIDQVFLVGTEFSQCQTSSVFTKLATSSEAQALFAKLTQADNSILIKGSRGMRMEKILNL